jgi:hypothetical protein
MLLLYLISIGIAYVWRRTEDENDRTRDEEG